MDGVTYEKVMDRQKIASSIHGILDAGMDLLAKDKLESQDFAKIKVVRTMGPVISQAVQMIQQETAQQRHLIVLERMKQLGFGAPKQLTA